MKIIPKTMLKVDPKKPAFQAGKECDVKKDIAENLLERGLATLPVEEPIEQEADNNEGDQGSGD